MDQLFTDRHRLEGNVEPPTREIDSLQVSHYLQRPLRTECQARRDIAETERRREQSRQNRLG